MDNRLAAGVERNRQGFDGPSSAVTLVGTGGSCEQSWLCSRVGGDHRRFLGGHSGTYVGGARSRKGLNLMSAPAIPTIVPTVDPNPRPLRKKRTLLSGRADPRAISGLIPPARIVNQGGTIIYEYTTPPGIQAINGGGAIIVSAPLKVLFWGHGWTLDATKPSMADVQAAVNAIIASPYLKELSQYGFSRIASVDFFQVLADPPSPKYTGSDVEKMVWGAIDSAFPEPDEDGGRNIYMVFPHPGTNYDNPGLDAAGAHSDPSENDFLFLDADYAWVGWADYSPTIDGITSVFTHELVEMISDPEPHKTAWTTNQPGPENEIADVCLGRYGPAGGYEVSAYFSARLGQCVVPSDGLLRYIQLSEQDKSIGDIFISRGETGADRNPNCFNGTYHWILYNQPRQATIVADVSSYVDANLTWSVNGQQDLYGGSIQVPVDNTYDPLNVITTMPPETAEIAVDVSLAGKQLTLTCPAGAGQVTLTVSCTAEEGASGYVGYGTERTDTLSVWMSGRTRYMDSRFTKDRVSCFIRRFTGLYELVGVYVDKGDPVPPWVERSLATLEEQLEGLELSTERLTSLLRKPPRPTPPKSVSA
jgi:hypothetical protein